MERCSQLYEIIILNHYNFVNFHYLNINDKILIEKVHQYDELYNMTHRKYSNHHKDIIWAKMFFY